MNSPLTLPIRRRAAAFVSLLLLIALLDRDGPAAEIDSSRDEIARLETELFESDLPLERLKSLLADLENPAKREAAKGVLSREGHRHVAAIIEFARTCRDVEARQTCADIVEALDASYTTDAGRRLGESYRSNARMLPEYWKRFRADSSDFRAVAFLMAVDPQSTYDWLQKHGDRHDPLRYLLLRVREASPDDFVLTTIFDPQFEGSIEALRWITPEVFPVKIFRVAAHRQVGHVALKCFSIGAGLDTKRVPAQSVVSSLTIERRRVGVYQFLNRRNHHLAIDTMYAVWIPQDRIQYKSNKGTWRDGPVPPAVGRATARVEVESATIASAILPIVEISDPPGLSFTPRTRELLPAEFHSRIDPRAPEIIESIADTPMAGERAPEWSLPAPRKPIADLPPAGHGWTVVVLPPQISATAPERERGYALLAADYLASGLEARKIRVVDRQRLEDVLRERNLDASAKPPLLAYDLLVRLRVEPKPRPAPFFQVRPDAAGAESAGGRAELLLLDLSLGTKVARQEVAWPIPENELVELVENWATTIRERTPPVAEMKKVRLLRGEDPDRSPRIVPLVARLQAFFAESLSEVDSLILVEHLEAATAKEEALLLEMNMSRLAGGRTFAPQADVSLAWTIAEEKSVGKTFEETPLTVTMTVRRADGEERDTFTETGTVAEFDHLVAKLWRALVVQLDGISLEQAETVLSQREVRRKQSLVERKVAQELLTKIGIFERLDVYSPIVVLMHALPSKEAPLADPDPSTLAVRHAAAAVKLDPGSKEAHLLYQRALATNGVRLRQQPGKATRAQSLLDEYFRFVERFGVREVDESMMNFTLGGVIYSTPLITLAAGHLVADGDVPPGAIESLKRIIDTRREALADEFHLPAQRVLTTIYKGMRLNGVPVEERERWLDQLLDAEQARLERLERGSKSGASLELDRIKDRQRWDEWQRYLLALTTALELAEQDRRGERARPLLARCIAASNRCGHCGLKTDYIREKAPPFADPELLAWFDATVPKPPTGRPAPIHWHIAWGAPIEVFDTRRQLDPIKPTDIGYATERDAFQSYIRPVLATDDRLYVLLFQVYPSHDQTPRFAWMPLDSAGHPEGEALRVERSPIGATRWSTIKTIDWPKNLRAGPLHVNCLRQWKDKIYIATKAQGLLIYDPKGESWKVVTPEEGLPDWNVERLFPVGGGLLHCTTSVVAAEQQREFIDYFFDTTRHTVRVARRDRERDVGQRRTLDLIWKHDGDWYGLRQFARDDPAAFRGAVPAAASISAAGGSPTHAEQWQTSGPRHSFRIFPVATVGDRHYRIDPDGGFGGTVVEFAPNGTIIKRFQRPPRNLFLPFAIPTEPAPSELRNPLSGQVDLVVAVGKYLAIQGANGLFLYDPPQDTWYGPIPGAAGPYDPTSEHADLLGTPHGIWTSSVLRNIRSRTMAFMPLEDLLRAAEKSGRVNTSEEYLALQRAAADKAPPLQAARFWVREKEYDRAERALLAQLDERTEDPDALWFLGMLHREKKLAPAHAAEDYFRRLSRNEKDNIAGHGLYLLAKHLFERGDLEGASECLEELDRRCPGVWVPDGETRTDLEKAVKALHLAIKKAAQPADPRPTE
ncbi:MAG: hypothetical protein WD069_22910 [Planctomycetales bacterium]